MIKIGAQQGQENMVNDEHDVHVISLFQGQDPGQTRGKNDGFSTGWVGLSALSEGIIQDVILGLNEVVGEIEILYNFGRQLCEHQNLANDNTGHISRQWPA